MDVGSMVSMLKSTPESENASHGGGEVQRGEREKKIKKLFGYLAANTYVSRVSDSPKPTIQFPACPRSQIYGRLFISFDFTFHSKRICKQLLGIFCDFWFHVKFHDQESWCSSGYSALAKRLMPPPRIQNPWCRDERSMAFMEPQREKNPRCVAYTRLKASPWRYLTSIFKQSNPPPITIVDRSLLCTVPKPLVESARRVYHTWSVH
ncbi:hypothetical protein M408DRAFT_160636 [Serendipita vermifera MAFF 305830]|uniref:Uncharacterized protein n=1 Tax=Serendipita vermifera MAFF 305830 TaxID=933852 RepID=A0A0C2WNS2_SERVB|nr:hypothetical protein M408DRAFT_160636 [Serendipita vermifera MAFF 305830]